MLEKGSELFKYEQELFKLKKKWVETVNKDNVEQAKQEVIDLLDQYDNKEQNRPYAFYMAMGFYDYLDFTAREGVVRG